MWLHRLWAMTHLPLCLSCKEHLHLFPRAQKPWVWGDRYRDLPILQPPKTMLLSVNSPNKTPFTNKWDWSGLFLGFSAPSAFGGRVAYAALSWNRRQCSTSRSRTNDLAEHGRWSRGLLSRTSLSTALLHGDRSHAGWMALHGALFTLRVLMPYALPLFC